MPPLCFVQLRMRRRQAQFLSGALALQRVPKGFKHEAMCAAISLTAGRQCTGVDRVASVCSDALESACACTRYVGTSTVNFLADPLMQRKMTHVDRWVRSALRLTH